MLYAKHFTLIISFRLSEVSAEGITSSPPFFFTDEKFLLRALGRQWRDGVQIQVVTLFPVIFLFHQEVFFIDRWWWFSEFVSPGKFRRTRVRNQGWDELVLTDPLHTSLPILPTNPTTFSKQLASLFYG